MPKQAKELSALEVKRIAKPGLHAVGGVAGLHLRVYPSGTKAWVLRTTIAGRRRDIGMGGYPTTTLAQARERAREDLDKIRQGEDPIRKRQEARATLMAAQRKSILFREATYQRYRDKESEFRNAKHRQDWISSLERYAFPVIGDLPLHAIEVAHILEILRPYWTDKTETLTRVRQRIESVFSWATANRYYDGPNPATWKNNLEHLLPAPGKVRRQGRMAAIPWQEVPAFVADLRNREGMGARALEFIILTAARSGEARLATWDEVDFETRVWRIPASRMKAREDHTVPLSEDAVALLKALPRFEGSDYVFTAPRGGALSDMSISAVCRRMGVNAVPHGFRSSFRDWTAEASSYPHEVAEKALAHKIPSAVERAYRRGDLLEKRRRMMEDWARFCRECLPAGEVVPIGEART